MFLRVLLKTHVFFQNRSGRGRFCLLKSYQTFLTPKKLFGNITEISATKLAFIIWISTVKLCTGMNHWQVKVNHRMNLFLLCDSLATHNATKFLLKLNPIDLGFRGWSWSVKITSCNIRNCFRSSNLRYLGNARRIQFEPDILVNLRTLSGSS